MLPNKIFQKRLSHLPHKIDELINDNDTRKLNGCILIAQGENVIYQKCHGSLGQPIITHQFAIGSISKQFTAVVLLKLVDQKLIDLDQPIQKYLPNLPDQWAKIVTLRHLLNHTSGVKKLGEPLEFLPGTKFKYSPTLAYYLCSQIAEQVTGIHFENLLNELFISAKMKNTAIINHGDFICVQKKHPFLIQGFKENKDKILHNVVRFGEEKELFDHTWIAGGGIISTLHDLLQWNLSLHKGYLISESCYSQMITPSAIRQHPRYGTINYGLGVQLVNPQNLEISHSGYIDGFTTTLIYYPKTEISIIVLENISLDTSDIKRAFSIHDKLRDVIRSQIICIDKNDL